MLTEPLPLNRIDAGQIFDYLYGFFHRDFIACKTHLASKILIDPQSDRKEDGKECSFWHLTTREQSRQIKNKVTGRYENFRERLPDFSRSKRIEWVKKIIENHDHEDILCFYHQESTGKKPIRFYMWADKDSFVVILQKLGNSRSFLVTSFYIDHDDKHKDYQHRYERYKSGQAQELLGCEWF